MFTLPLNRSIAGPGCRTFGPSALPQRHPLSEHWVPQQAELPNGFIVCRKIFFSHNLFYVYVLLGIFWWIYFGFFYYWKSLLATIRYVGCCRTICWTGCLFPSTCTLLPGESYSIMFIQTYFPSCHLVCLSNSIKILF